jgi:ribosome-binding protein aMBF1 (putative translation factor)
VEKAGRATAREKAGQAKPPTGANVDADSMRNRKSTSEARNGEGNMSSRSSDAVDKHVGNRVRMRRLMLGLSQGKLADQLELTFQQVQKPDRRGTPASAVPHP